MITKTIKTAADLSVPLSSAEREALRVLESDIFNHVGRIETSGNSIGAALAQIQEGLLWRATHPSFEEYLEAKFDFEKSQAYRLIAFAQTARELAARQLPPATERRLRLLAPLPLEKRADAYAQAMKRDGGDGVPSAAIIGEVVAKLTEAPPETARQVNRTLGHPDYRKDADLSNAIERISDLCGSASLKKALVSGDVPMTRGELIGWAAQKDGRVVELEKLITVNRWELKRANRFLDDVPDADTKISSGINYAIANGGACVVENVGGGTTVFFTSEKWKSCRKHILSITEK